MSTGDGQSGVPQSSRHTGANHLQHRHHNIYNNPAVQPRSNVASSSSSSSSSSIGRREVPLSAYTQLERLYPDPEGSIQNHSSVPAQQLHQHNKRSLNHVVSKPSEPNGHHPTSPNNTAVAQSMSDLGLRLWSEYQAHDNLGKQKFFEHLHEREQLPQALYEILKDKIREASRGQNATQVVPMMQQQATSPPIQHQHARSPTVGRPPDQSAHLVQDRSRRFTSAASLEAARFVFTQYLPIDFAPGPRFIPQQVKDYSARYMQDRVRSTAEAIQTSTISAADPANPRSLMMAIDSRPVPEVIREAASGVGRLVGLLPAADLLDREAHSFLNTIMCMQASLSQHEARAKSAEARMVRMEHEMRKLQQSNPLEAEQINGTQSQHIQLLQAISNLNKEVRELSHSQRDMYSHLVKLENRVRSNEEDRQKELLADSAVSGFSIRRNLHEEGVQVNIIPPKASQEEEFAQELTGQVLRDIEALEQEIPSQTNQPTSHRPAPNQSAFRPLGEPAVVERVTEERNRTSPTVRVSVRSVSSEPLDSVAKSQEQPEEEKENDRIETPAAVKDEAEEDDELDEIESSLPGTRQLASGLPSRFSTPENSSSKEEVVADDIDPSRSLRKVSLSPNSKSSKKRKRFGMETSFLLHNGQRIESIVIDSSDDDYSP